MNKQIRNLMEQSKAFTYDEDGNELTPFLEGKRLEKFAELIVRECAEWMRDGNIPDGFYEAGRMLEHFGVKE